MLCCAVKERASNVEQQQRPHQRHCPHHHCWRLLLIIFFAGAQSASRSLPCTTNYRRFRAMVISIGQWALSGRVSEQKGKRENERKRKRVNECYPADAILNDWRPIMIIIILCFCGRSWNMCWRWRWRQQWPSSLAGVRLRCSQRRALLPSLPPSSVPFSLLFWLAIWIMAKSQQYDNSNKIRANTILGPILSFAFSSLERNRKNRNRKRSSIGALFKVQAASWKGCKSVSVSGMVYKKREIES